MGKLDTFTVLIHTHNEEKNIHDCITSAKKLTEKIIVIDMESTDNTTTIAKQNNAVVYSFPFSYYVEPSRNFGVSNVDTEWLFIIDADERITPELATEINHIVTQEHTHYKVPRKNVFGKAKWLKHGGWWPDHQLRLIKKSAFVKWPKRIHSTPEITGTVGYLQQPFIHYFHGNLHEMVDKTIIYENIEADLLFDAHRDSSTPIFFRKYIGEFYRRFVKKLGFLDGEIGIIECVYQAFSKTITYLFLYEKKKSGSL